VQRAVALVALTALAHMAGIEGRLEARTACGSWSVVASPQLSDGSLTAVVATSPTNAWAVGEHPGPSTVTQGLIERWNGTSWKELAPAIGEFTYLSDVDAISATDAWAVGTHIEPDSALAVHWNGRRWRVQVPSVPGSSFLDGVDMVSATDVWAVGGFSQHGSTRTLVLHYDGRAWKRVPSPNVGTASDVLVGVSAVPNTGRVWAVGSHGPGNVPLTERYRGTEWRAVPVRQPSRGWLGSVEALHPADVWAVGHTSGRALIEHWDGNRWTVARNQRRSGATKAFLFDVDAASGTGAWSVGQDSKGALIKHWDGTAWRVQKVPDTGARSGLAGVDVVPGTTEAWAVGHRGPLGKETGLIEHVC
jgi:hypothetical protein